MDPMRLVKKSLFLFDAILNRLRAGLRPTPPYTTYGIHAHWLEEHCVGARTDKVTTGLNRAKSDPEACDSTGQQDSIGLNKVHPSHPGGPGSLKKRLGLRKGRTAA